ncbi:MAG: hypothetical protein FJ320_04095 [SAR202 cluster bacterium]|nr:hypothetical protein [SAR202 cluster bacterium]
MYLERIIVRVKYGANAQMAEVLKRLNEDSIRHSVPKARLLQSTSGRQGTFVIEREYDSYDQYAAARKQQTTSKEFRTWYQDFHILVDEASNEYFNILA